MAAVGTDHWNRDSAETQKEILPDGTVHHKIVLTRSRTDSLDKVAETIETFDKPPRPDDDTEQIEEILPDGTKVMRSVAMHRVVHCIKTRHESFDESSGRKVEDYEVEEVVPGTASAFDAGLDSDYEEEVRAKQEARRLSVDQDMEEIEEILPDGTKVRRQVALSRVVHTTKDRSHSFDAKAGHVKEDYPTEEVVPGTTSAFIAGQDSDQD